MSLTQVHTTLGAGGLRTPKWCYNSRIIGQVKLMFAINSKSIHEKAWWAASGEHEEPQTAAADTITSTP